MTDPHHARDDFDLISSIHWPEESGDVPKDYFVRQAKLLRIVDGDTLRFEIDQGFGSKLTHDIRLKGLDTPEKRGKEAYAGQWVTEQVEKWFGGEIDKLERCTIWSVEFELGKFGRCLCHVWFNGRSLNEWLLNKRYAWPADESGKIVGPRDLDRLNLPAEIMEKVRMGS